MNENNNIDFNTTRMWGVVCSNEMAWHHLDSVSAEVKERIFRKMNERSRKGEVFHPSKSYPTKEKSDNGSELTIDFRKVPLGHGFRMVLNIK